MSVQVLGVQVFAVASGSNGNCYYVGNQCTGILIDVGISSKQLLLRLNRNSIDIHSIQGIFITHDHSDHTRGIEVLLKKYSIPVFITKNMQEKLQLAIPSHLINYITIGESVCINDFHVTSFLKSHDGIDPLGFSILYNSLQVVVLTDLGKICSNVKLAVKNAHCLFLEANYDEELLKTCGYPYFLQQRIASEKGHLSNALAGEILEKYVSSSLQYVFLSHLSKNSNTPSLAKETIEKYVQKRTDLSAQILLTSRERETEVITLIPHL